MFIRYNEAGYIWEYDTSAGQVGAGPWVKLPIDYSQLINVPPSGVQAHHATHESGGNDKIVNLELSGSGPLIKFGGTTVAFPALRYTGAVLEVVTANNADWAGIKAKNFVSTGNSNNLVDLTVGATNFTAGINVSAGNYLSATGSIIQSGGYIYPGQVGAGSQGSWYIAGHSSYGLYINTGLYVAAGIWHNSTMYGAGGGYYYPANSADGGNQQSSYYLSAHTSVFGLYTNNDIYAQRYMHAISFLAHGLLKEYDRDIGLGHWDNFTPVIKNSSGPIAFQNPPTGRFTLVGNSCTFLANFDLTGIPSLGTGLEFDYPLPAAAEVGPGAMIGSVVLSNGDNVLREGNIAHTDSAKSRFLVGLLGAAGDTLRVKGVYEIAEYRNILPPLEVFEPPPTPFPAPSL